MIIWLLEESRGIIFHLGGNVDLWQMEFFFFKTNNPTMAEFIEWVKVLAYVLCFKLMRFTHICSGFRSCAIGGTLVQGVQGRRKKPSCTRLTKAELFQHCPRYSAIRDMCSLGKWLKWILQRKRRFIHWLIVNRASIQCKIVCQALRMKQWNGRSRLQETHSQWWRWISHCIVRQHFPMEAHARCHGSPEREGLSSSAWSGEGA